MASTGRGGHGGGGHGGGGRGGGRGFHGGGRGRFFGGGGWWGGWPYGYDYSAYYWAWYYQQLQAYLAYLQQLQLYYAQQPAIVAPGANDALAASINRLTNELQNLAQLHQAMGVVPGTVVASTAPVQPFAVQQPLAAYNAAMLGQF